jgi:hypothetical protein
MRAALLDAPTAAGDRSPAPCSAVISRERALSLPYTINTHPRHVFAKLGIRSRTELAVIAAERARERG